MVFPKLQPNKVKPEIFRPYLVSSSCEVAGFCARYVGRRPRPRSDYRLKTRKIS